MTTLHSKSNSITDRMMVKVKKQVTYSSGELFQGDKSVVIDHHGEHYLLRITKSSKLILTK